MISLWFCIVTAQELIKRSLTCTTFAGGNREAETLIPKFPRGPLNHFWKCGEGKVSHARRARPVCLTLQEPGPLITAAPLLCASCIIKACEGGEQEIMEQEWDQERTARWHHLSTWLSQQPLWFWLIICINLMMTEKDWRNDYDVCRCAGAF